MKKRLVLAALVMSAGIAFAADDMSTAAGSMGNMDKWSVDKCLEELKACGTEQCKEDIYKNHGCPRNQPGT